MESTTGPLWKSSLAAFKSLSLCLIVGSFIVMCLREDLFHLSLFGDSWASGSWMFKSLPRFGRFSAVFSSNKLYATFSFFSSMTPIIYRFFKMIFYQSHSVSSLFPLLFISLWLEFQRSCLLIYRFFLWVWSILMLILFIAFFILFSVLFSSRISVWLFFPLLALLNFSFCSCTLFPISLYSLCVFSCSSKTAIFNSLSNKSQLSRSFMSLLGGNCDPWWCHVTFIYHAPLSLASSHTK